MTNQKLIEDIRNAANRWEEENPIIGVGALRYCDALRAAAYRLEDLDKQFADILRRTAEDDKAREEGRLVELPIPIGGDMLAYGIYEEDGIPAHIVTIECDRLDGLEIWPTGEIVVRVDGWEIGKSDISKTVFLTRQEAEAALGCEQHG